MKGGSWVTEEHEGGGDDGESVPVLSSSETGNGVQCPHLGKSVSVAGLRKAFKGEVKSSCRPCSYLPEGSTSKQCWVCVQCGNVACGDSNAQDGDAATHFKTPRSDLHAIVVQLGMEYRCWCFLCQAEVNCKSGILKDAVVLVKKHVKGRLAYAIVSEKKNEGSVAGAGIPTISLPSPPPPPLPAPPVSFKLNNGKKEPKGKPQFKPNDAFISTRKPLGLENLGNTCFMNAALQCLSRTRFLIPKLELYGSGQSVPLLVSEMDDKTNITVVNPSERNGEIPEEQLEELPEIQNGDSGMTPFLINLNISPDSMTARLKHTFKAITRHDDLSNGTEAYTLKEFNPRQGYPHVFKPYEVHNMLTKNFRPGSQHDSHELLRTIVDMLKKDQTKAFRTAIMKKFDVAKGGEGSDPKMVELVKSLDQKTKHQTFVDEIFGGELMTTQTCLTCRSIKRSHEEFLDLSLPIRVITNKGNNNETSKKPSTSSFRKASLYSDYSDNENIVINKNVEECLNTFTEPELLTGINAVECENCHRINLELLKNGAAFEDVFPNAKITEPPPATASTSGTNSGTQSQKGEKGPKNKRQDEKKKRRPARQTRLKNQMARAEQENQEPSKDKESSEELVDAAAAGPSSSMPIVENHFTSKEASEGEGSKSTLDDYVVIANSDVIEKNNFMDQLIDDNNEFEMTPLFSDLDTDHVPCRDTGSLPDIAAAINDEEFRDDGDNGDLDFEESDWPSAADGIGGSASDCEGDNGVPPLELDADPDSDYDKFKPNYYHVPRVCTSGKTPTPPPGLQGESDEEKEKPIKDEGVYSDGSGKSAESCNKGSEGQPLELQNEGAPKTFDVEVSGNAMEVETELLVQPAFQGSSRSSTANSSSDTEDSKKDENSGKKEPPVTKCPCARQQTISRPPEFLTIHLKRFQLSFRGFTSKLNEFIEFPFVLDLTKYCSFVSEDAKEEILDEDGEVIYNLYGLVEHSGSMNWGHYVAYVKAPAEEGDKDGWYYASDSLVQVSDEESVAQKDAYILFYERIRGDAKKEVLKDRIGNASKRSPDYFATTTNNWATSSSSAGDTAQKWSANWDDEIPVQGPALEPESQMVDPDIFNTTCVIISPDDVVEEWDDSPKKNENYCT